MVDRDNKNTQQIEYWNGTAGVSWSERDDEMDAMLRPLGETAIDRAAPLSGESVLDIGCGCGATTLLLAERVGAQGAVLGVDISGPMLAHASSKIGFGKTSERADVAFVQADAAAHDFPVATYDLLFSRFGVMFFDDPSAAFANMRKALKPGGRLTFLCWGPMQENEWITLPMREAMALLPASQPTDPRDPGPFAFSDTNYVKQILSDAGFHDIQIEATSPIMKMGRGRSIEEMAEFFMDMGPVSRALQGQEEHLRAPIRDVIVNAIKDRYINGVLELNGQCRVVTAKN